MNPVTGVVLFSLIWWTVLFAVLPFGTQADANPDPVTGWRGTPTRPRLARKALITTALTVAIWLAVYGISESGWITFREGWLALPSE